MSVCRISVLACGLVSLALTACDKPAPKAVSSPAPAPGAAPVAAPHALPEGLAITDTAPGHASLHTGQVPAESGVSTNEVPDEQTGKRRSVFIDERTEVARELGAVHDDGDYGRRVVLIQGSEC